MTNDEYGISRHRATSSTTPRSKFQFISIAVAALRPERLTAVCCWAVEDVSKTDDFDVSCLADEAMAASLTYALEKTGKETMATFVISVAVSIM